jgi:hypothetical protein
MIAKQTTKQCPLLGSRFLISSSWTAIEDQCSLCSPCRDAILRTVGAMSELWDIHQTVRMLAEDIVKICYQKVTSGDIEGFICAAVKCVIQWGFIVTCIYELYVLGDIHNFWDWCCHLYSSCSSTMQQYMVVLAYLWSQCTKFHAAEWMCRFFTSFYLESCI